MEALWQAFSDATMAVMSHIDVFAASGCDFTREAFLAASLEEREALLTVPVRFALMKYFREQAIACDGCAARLHAGADALAELALQLADEPAAVPPWRTARRAVGPRTQHGARAARRRRSR